ncbi:hypothetical protein M231_07646 [Tremella mesenterica]|uniref:Major facilitator superfamily (MFS) profile domain-containing protein n=1 Tax=Tremella mesenterica TaxID=5217 RepID=A0A4Q1BBQ7_TREME|nr:hypothetical protein M231_07646 [Tremella mesenterica]
MTEAIAPVVPSLDEKLPELFVEDATKDPALMGPPSYTPKEESKVRLKMDLILLPVLCLMNLCSFLDKANIGNANTAGLSKSLHLTTAQYNLLLTIFYVVYTIMQWEFMLLKYFPPKYFLTFIVTFWGLTSCLQGITTSYGGLMACRVVIAALEAGGGPAIAFYFTMIYPRKDFGFRWAVFQATSCIANAFAGAMAYGLVQAKTSLEPWKLVYIVESAPTFLSAILLFIFLPSAPDKCIFLNKRENEIARERIERDIRIDEHKGFRWPHFKKAVVDPWVWWIALIHFFGGAAFNSLGVFLTAIIKEMGYTSINAQGLSAPPYILAFILAVTTAYYSDKLSIRGYFIAIANLIGAVGYIVIAFAGPTGARYFATYITVIGVYVGQPLMFSWCAANASSDSKRAVSLVIFLMTGQCGSILGSNVYNDPPRYHKGNGVCAGGLFADCVLCITGVAYLKWRNHKKDLKYGKPDPDAQIIPTEDGTDHPAFRYVL